MKLHFERVLPCPPETAFGLISDPAAMNLWSGATVRVTALGDGRHPAGVGALREVTLPGRPRRVLREIVEVSTPPHDFVYRIVSGAPVTSHESQIRIAPEAAGCRLTWDVKARFSMPGLALIARRRIAPALSASLDRLVEVAGRSPGIELPPVRNLYEDDVLPSLYEEAVALAEAQRVLADELRAAGDTRALITRAYQWLTEEGIAACRKGELRHPAFVLRLLVRVHRPYAENLDRWLHRAEGAPEGYWRAIFEQASSDRPGTRHERSRRAVALALDALMSEDLPQALAAVYVTSYADRCDYELFRADFHRLDPIFARLSKRLDAVLHRGALPRSVRAAAVILPPDTREAFAIRRISHLARRHRDAFERGGRIVRFLREPR